MRTVSRRICVRTALHPWCVELPQGSPPVRSGQGRPNFEWTATRRRDLTAANDATEHKPAQSHDPEAFRRFQGVCTGESGSHVSRPDPSIGNLQEGGAFPQLSHAVVNADPLSSTGDSRTLVQKEPDIPLLSHARGNAGPMRHANHRPRNSTPARCSSDTPTAKPAGAVTIGSTPVRH